MNLIEPVERRAPVIHRRGQPTRHVRDRPMMLGKIPVENGLVVGDAVPQETHLGQRGGERLARQEFAIAGRDPVQGALPQIVLLAPEHRGPEAEGQGGDDAAILDRLARFRQFGDRRTHLFSLTVGDVTGLGLEPARAGGFGHHRVNAVSQRHLQSLERHIEGLGHPGV